MQNKMLTNFGFLFSSRGRIGCGLVVSLAFPLSLLPCREALFEIPVLLYGWNATRNAQQVTDNQIDDAKAADEETPLVSQRFEPKAIPQTPAIGETMHVALTFILLVSCYVFAIAVPGVEVVWSICGSLLGFFVAYILPAACYIKLRSPRKGHLNSRIMSAWVLLIVSIAGAIMCTGNSFYAIFWSQV